MLLTAAELANMPVIEGKSLQDVFLDWANEFTSGDANEVAREMLLNLSARIAESE